MSREPTTIQRLAERFRTALQSLGFRADDEAQLETWAVLVHECMAGQGRTFHTAEHVFDVGAGTDAIGTLAALFHDTVYYQVDGGLPRRLEPLLRDAIEVEPGALRLRAAPAGDSIRALIDDVFGFHPGQVLSPFGGLNEFLSALLAARELANVVTPAVLAQLAACIEATIPFRTADPAAQLEARLLQVDQKHRLGLGREVIEAAVHRAVDLANRDVANFAEEDPARFLDNTWALLPESNASLRASVYTIREYLTAMQKMEGFFSSLDPGVIFASYRGQPERASFEKMVGHARRNVEVGRRYLRAKVLAAGVLRAVAELSGGDAPVALLMGDLPRPGREPTRLEDSLGPPPSTASDVQPDVLALLRDGRAHTSGFDLKNAPLAALLYVCLGDAATDRAVAHIKTELQGPARQRELLAMLPRPVLVSIVEAARHVAPTRAGRLAAILQ